jgi:hypothetical protein
MAAPVAAAVLIRRAKQLVARLESGRAWARLEGGAVIRATPDGRFYLDSPSWEARERTRVRRLALVMLVAVTMAVAAWLRAGRP